MKYGLIRNGTLILVLWTGVALAPESASQYVNIVVYGFIVSNLISIAENLGEAGVPIPTNITKYLKALQEKEKEKDDVK